MVVRRFAPEPLGVAKLKNPKKERALYFAEAVSFIHACVSLLLSELWVDGSSVFELQA